MIEEGQIFDLPREEEEGGQFLGQKEEIELLQEKIEWRMEDELIQVD